MPDREKVMETLEHCSDRTQKRCNPTCPYYERDFCETELASDALTLMKEQQEKIDRLLEESASNAEMAEGFAELLKEQGALKPKKVKGYNPPMYTIYEYECEKCKSPMMNKQPYCMGCGRRVIWDA